MSYIKDIESLIGALSHNVITPDQGWAQLEALDDERAQRRVARKDALAEMLAGIQSAGYETALEGGTLESVLANPTVAQAQRRFGADTLTQVLSPYFNTTQPEIPYAPDPGYGQSRLNPQLPSTEIASITNAVIKASQKGTTLEDVKSAIHSRAQETYGPSYGTMAADIDKIIESVFVR